MYLTKKLNDYIAAGFSGIWIETAEPYEAQREILTDAEDYGWSVARWDVGNGLFINGTKVSDMELGTPIPALRILPSLKENRKEGEKSSLMIVHNLHMFFTDKEVIQVAHNSIMESKSDQCFLVVLSPVTKIPKELERLFVVIEHSLPDKDELKTIATDLLKDADITQEVTDKIVDAASGLIRFEAEGAFALSLARHDKIKPDVISEIKGSTLKKTSLLSLYRGKTKFENLGGLDELKKFTLKALTGPKNRVAKARGIMVVGVQGAGKSEVIKALGNETGMPVVCGDIGSCFGSLLGDTESNFREIFKVADAMAPCILMFDEIEKGLRGVGTNNDGGAGDRGFATMLTWLNDHETDVFVACTSNDISLLPPEFTRAERFDGIFFVDLPTSKEKDLIWPIYRKMYGIKDQPRPDDTNWTGAEIKSCCRLASLLDESLTQVARNIVPVAITAKEKIDTLRQRASGRYRDANKPGIYEWVKKDSEGTELRRKINRKENTSEN